MPVDQAGGKGTPEGEVAPGRREKKTQVGGDGHSSSQSDSDEDSDEDGQGKRAREIEQDEAKALKEDLGQDLRVGKRLRRAEGGDEGQEVEGDSAGALSSQSEQEWKAFKMQAESTGELERSEQTEDMVLVRRSFRFAGEEVKEEKYLPASHPDAIAFLKSKEGAATTKETTACESSPPTRPKAGPRKKKSSLAAMSAAATGKPSKINTLEKSKMDWNRFKEHTTNERERDEMEAQTKGGGSGLGSMKGYLERRGFLDRVQDRLEEHKK